MSRKPKFKPEITRIKLNPEQAVLGCNCYDGNCATYYAPGYWCDWAASFSYCHAGAFKGRIAICESGSSQHWGTPGGSFTSSS